VAKEGVFENDLLTTKKIKSIPSPFAQPPCTQESLPVKAEAAA
jgi:hypothetical protein